MPPATDAYYGQNTYAPRHNRASLRDRARRRTRRRGLPPPTRRKIRETLNNLILKSPQDWQTSVALPFVRADVSNRAIPPAPSLQHSGLEPMVRSFSDTAKAIKARQQRAEKKQKRISTPIEGVRETLVAQLAAKIVRNVVRTTHRRAEGRKRKELYNQRHPERAAASAAKTKQKNHQKHRTARLANMAVYRENNKERIAALLLAWQRKRRLEDPVHLLKDRCRSCIYMFLNSKGKKKSAKTSSLIGCSFAFLHKRLSHRKPGDHIDHIFPLSAYKTMDERQQRQAMHYTNLQILTKEENLEKRDRMPTQAMADKTLQCNWPPGIKFSDLPVAYPGWTSGLRK